MKKTLFILAIGLLTCSCGSGNQNNQQRIISYEVEINPPLQNGITNNTYNMMGVAVAGGFGFSWNGANESVPLSTKQGDDFLWYSGNLPIIISLVNTTDLVCRTINIDIYVDGSLFDSRSYLMGTDNLSGVNGCDDGTNLSYNLIIP